MRLKNSFLEVAHGSGEQRALSVAWKRDDLERLLELDGSEFTLMFKSDDLERAIDDDVEAHGVRNRALVLSVAVVGAAVAASTAAAAGQRRPASREPSASTDRDHRQALPRGQPGREGFHGVRPDAGPMG